MWKYNKVFQLLVLAFPAFMCFIPFIVSGCDRPPAIFNFGDSNSDTGGFSAALGFIYGYPDARAFFHQPTGRLCDGRLIIDFLCENLNTSYLYPYLDSLRPSFANGVNFAIAGSATLPKYVPFSLDVQILQFRRFYNHSIGFQSEDFKANLVSTEDFSNAIYTFDIGQNDLAGAFSSHLSYADVLEKIPYVITEIRDAMWAIYLLGGRNFWIHNTGPLGCLPQRLATTTTNATDFDQYGCIKSLNEAAKVFNTKLNTLCHELRSQMMNSTIIYVDIFSIKYDLIANSESYGFKNPLMACCGYGGPPYNYNPNVDCRGSHGYTVCEKSQRYISWDGIHYSEAANGIVVSKILSTKYSDPPLEFNYCNKKG